MGIVSFTDFRERLLLKAKDHVICSPEGQDFNEPAAASAANYKFQLAGKRGILGEEINKMIWVGARSFGTQTYNCRVGTRPLRLMWAAPQPGLCWVLSMSEPYPWRQTLRYLASIGSVAIHGHFHLHKWRKTLVNAWIVGWPISYLTAGSTITVLDWTSLSQELCFLQEWLAGRSMPLTYYSDTTCRHL